jgi:hypothetical protein
VEQQETQKPAFETAAASRCANCTVTGRETPTLAATTVPTHSNSHLVPQFYKTHITYTFFLSTVAVFFSPHFFDENFYFGEKIRNILSQGFGFLKEKSHQEMSSFDSD